MTYYAEKRHYIQIVHRHNIFHTANIGIRCKLMNFIQNCNCENIKIILQCHFYQTMGFPSSGTGGSPFSSPSVSGPVSSGASADKSLKLLIPSDPDRDKTSVESFFVANRGEREPVPEYLRYTIFQGRVAEHTIGVYPQFQAGPGDFILYGW